MSAKHLELYLHARYVGQIAPVPDDPTRIRLTVDDGFDDRGVTPTEAFTALAGRAPTLDAVSNFLGGYVPEGNHREQMAAKRRIDKNNLFALLDEFGGSIAGALTVRRPGESAASARNYEVLSDASLAEKLRQALKDNDQGIPDDSRSTLTGYQPKVLVARDGDGWAYPHGSAHSTWILKPQVPARPSRLIDEHYSHLLSRHAGLSSFRSEIRQAQEVTYLAIERFDRTQHGSSVELRHQEDLAQAMALDWRDTDVKFQVPAWPDDPSRATAGRIAQLLGDIPGGIRAVRAWLAQLTFHVAIGNNDAHAKNVALMHLPGRTELSQIYDAVPNLFQDGLIKFDLALAVGGVFDHRRLSFEHLQNEARSWGLISAPAASDTIGRTLATVGDAITAVTAPPGISPGVADQIGWTVERLVGGDEIGERPRAS